MDNKIYNALLLIHCENMRILAQQGYFFSDELYEDNLKAMKDFDNIFHDIMSSDKDENEDNYNVKYYS